MASADSDVPILPPWTSVGMVLIGIAVVFGLGVLLVRGLLRLPDEAATHHNV